MKWLIVLTLAASLAAISRGAEASADASTPAAETEPQLDGVVIEREDGTFMTMTLVGPRIVLSFFDEEKKPVAADVDRAAVRFQFPNRSPERRVLNPSDDGFTMTHSLALKGPFVFRAFITLLRGQDTEGETYTVAVP